MEHPADEPQGAGRLASAAPLDRSRKGTAVRMRIVTFGLNIPAEAYTAHAIRIAAEFTAWPGLLGKWWLGDIASDTFGGVYVFATAEDADLSRDSVLFRGMSTDPAFRDVTVREYDLLDAPTAMTAPSSQPASALHEPR